MRKLLLLVGLTSILFSCKKDEVLPIKNTHRVKSIYYNIFETDLLNKVEFIYTEENLSEIKMSHYINGVWIVFNKQTFRYEGDIVKVTRLSRETGKLQLNSKMEYIITDGRIGEEKYSIYYEGKYFDRWKYKYNYSAKKLTSWESFEMTKENQLFKPDGNGEFTYENGLPTTYNAFKKDYIGNWNQIEMEEFSSSNNHITNWITYAVNDSNNWTKYLNCNYLYTGNQITSAQYFLWNPYINSWETSPVLTNNYTYNENGYLIEENNGYESTEYEYEEGHGNAQLFWYFSAYMMIGEPTTLKNLKIKKEPIPYYKRINQISIR